MTFSHYSDRWWQTCREIIYLLTCWSEEKYSCQWNQSITLYRKWLYANKLKIFWTFYSVAYIYSFYLKTLCCRNNTEFPSVSSHKLCCRSNIDFPNCDNSNTVIYIMCSSLYSGAYIYSFSLQTLCYRSNTDFPSVFL